MAAEVSQAEHNNYRVLSELLTSMCHLIKLKTEVEPAEVDKHISLNYIFVPCVHLRDISQNL